MIKMKITCPAPAENDKKKVYSTINMYSCPAAKDFF